ncbi:hypothetical protein AM228_04425 [Planktothricoides sp. SR001]|uniref:hypothetical protein n=1 Tax=Planktothricoides sp. SR001 TaxID=1705388 RepID=UPI0006C6BFFA|nr:hypothetical protein [Planktothricoides sp. SR001]KOR38024.1 hypothetical protein AM228_04425 [Planktothricoides sp. SR001]
MLVDRAWEKEHGIKRQVNIDESLVIESFQGYRDRSILFFTTSDTEIHRVIIPSNHLKVHEKGWLLSDIISSLWFSVTLWFIDCFFTTSDTEIHRVIIPSNPLKVHEKGWLLSDIISSLWFSVTLWFIDCFFTTSDTEIHRRIIPKRKSGSIKFCIFHKLGYTLLRCYFRPTRVYFLPESKSSYPCRMCGMNPHPQPTPAPSRGAAQKGRGELKSSQII